MNGCERCGKLDQTLRASGFMYTISVILMTFRRGAGGIYCSSCRRKEGLKLTLVSALFGWWGFPWGPIYTLQSIGRNSAGGHQDHELNAQLLQAVAGELMERGDSHGAIQALEESLRLNDDAATRQALWSIQGEVVTSGTELTAPAADASPVVWSSAASTSFTPGALVRSRHGDVPMHAAPGGSADSIGSLGPDPAIVTRAEAGWVELRIPSGKAGWVPTTAIESAQPPTGEGG